MILKVVETVFEYFAHGTVLHEMVIGITLASLISIRLVEIVEYDPKVVSTVKLKVSP